jgi:hypothetical protein
MSIPRFYNKTLRKKGNKFNQKPKKKKGGRNGYVSC